jgi:hypothetical protein
MKTVTIGGIEMRGLCAGCVNQRFYMNDQTAEGVLCRKYNGYMYVNTDDDRKCSQYEEGIKAGIDTIQIFNDSADIEEFINEMEE